MDDNARARIYAAIGPSRNEVIERSGESWSFYLIVELITSAGS